MSGSAKKTTERQAIMKAMATPPPGGYFVWNGADEDDRPATEEELQDALAAAGKRRGRPAGSSTKEQVALRLDREVVTAFRASGPGWQTRMNDVLREWVKEHPVSSP
jgi:uncharacterized protein (DUF4415 family)